MAFTVEGPAAAVEAVDGGRTEPPPAALPGV